MPAITFKELAIGEAFKFANGVDSFNSVCVKVSPRCYKWRAQGGDFHRSKVGTVSVKVTKTSEAA